MRINILNGYSYLFLLNNLHRIPFLLFFFFVRVLQLEINE